VRSHARLTPWGLLTPRMHALCDEAQREGFAVKRHGFNSLLIGKQRPGVAVVVHLAPSGGFYAANRADTDLSVCTAIRTLKVVRKILGLEES